MLRSLLSYIDTMAKVYATYEEAARSSSYTYYKIRVAISTESVPQLVKKTLGFGTYIWRKELESDRSFFFSSDALAIHTGQSPLGLVARSYQYATFDLQFNC